jgi:hypothetical protein
MFLSSALAARCRLANEDQWAEKYKIYIGTSESVK